LCQSGMGRVRKEWKGQIPALETRTSMREKVETAAETISGVIRKESVVDSWTYGRSCGFMADIPSNDDGSTACRLDLALHFRDVAQCRFPQVVQDQVGAVLGGSW
jgi:hypothetical protein